MDDDEREMYRDAGAVSKRALDAGCRAIEVGVTYLEVAEAVEGVIFDADMQLAFPAIVAVNDVAAHYSPDSACKKEIGWGDVVSVDCGADNCGFMGDNARTIEVGTVKWSGLIDGSRKAIDMCIERAMPGVNVSDLSNDMMKVIASHGYQPVPSLMGHQMTRHNLHADNGLPNFMIPPSPLPEKDMVIACEIFASSGSGVIRAIGSSGIYMKGGRNISPRHESVVGCTVHPILKELISGSMVSHHEETVLITDDGCEVLTSL